MKSKLKTTKLIFKKMDGIRYFSTKIYVKKDVYRLWQSLTYPSYKHWSKEKKIKFAKKSKMIVKIKANTKEGKALISYIKSLSFVEIIEPKTKKNIVIEDLKQSIKQAKLGNTKPLKKLHNGK